MDDKNKTSYSALQILGDKNWNKYSLKERAKALVKIGLPVIASAYILFSGAMFVDYFSDYKENPEQARKIAEYYKEKDLAGKLIHFPRYSSAKLVLGNKD